MKKLSILTTVILFASVAGCANIQEEQKPTEASLQTRTAVVLGFDESKIKISGMRSTGQQTLYAVKTPKGNYDCMVPSGTLFAVSLVGIALPDPACTKQ
jgi:hypothetical protein